MDKQFRFRYRLAVCCMSVIFISSIAIAHGGKTDRYGGHNNRKSGGYHFHNPGYSHHASNPYQNHKTCGVCNAPKAEAPALGFVTPPKDKPKDEITAEDVKNMIMALQAGLKCMGYSITEINGEYNSETKAAVETYLKKSKK